MSDCVLIMGGGNIHGRMLIEALIDINNKPSLIINESGTKRSERLSRFLINTIDNPPRLESFGVDIVTVDQFDSDKTIDLIKSYSPEFLINGGAGIFKKSLLDVASPVNAHPGLLPYYRGMDPVLWSVYQKDPVGATVHIMTSGIDEGPIVSARQLPWKGAKSLLELRLQCMRWGSQLLAEYIDNPNDYLLQEQDLSEGSYYSSFPDHLIEKAERNLLDYVSSDKGNRCATKDES